MVSERRGIVTEIGIVFVCLCVVSGATNSLANFASVGQIFLLQIESVWRRNILGVHTVYMVVQIIEAALMNLSGDF
jgi:hypothetical protein